jgi:UDP-N-acetylmuramoylalanine--D-glutamate ligase
VNLKSIIPPGAAVLVLGLGRSGRAAIRLLQARGYVVRAADAGVTPDLTGTAEALRAGGIPVQLGPASPLPGDAVAAVISPGIAPDSAWIQPLVQAGIPLMGELEIGWRELNAPVLAVTGSSGKSTLVKFCADTLNGAGLRAVAAGNYGTPLSEIAMDTRPWDWVIAEVSSFQLETTNAFRPRIALLLNLHPNHLDRHGTMDAYRAAKMRLFQSLGVGDYALIPDDLADSLPTPPGVTRITFGLGATADWRFQEGIVRGGATAIDFRKSPFDNPVLGCSAAAAAAALTLAGVSAEEIGATAKRFERLPHRQQPVAEIDGIFFVDDSKATTLAALTAGLEMAPGPVRLIAGGRLKETDLNTPKIMLAKKTAGVYLIGESAEVLEKAWCKTVVCRRCGTLQEAVAQAWQEARTGETILLSPGCASFDQFRGYDDRGQCFTGLIQQLNSRGRK